MVNGSHNTVGKIRLLKIRNILRCQLYIKRTGGIVKKAVAK